MSILVCNFCLKTYDTEAKPKVVVIKGGNGKHICQVCVKGATELMKPEMGPDWPPKKGPKIG